MAIQHRPDWSKAVETLLYVTKAVHDMYAALKVIYFADKAHLEKYGRFIYWDNYIAMSHGPVPSVAYDIIKHARGDAVWGSRQSEPSDFSMSGNNVEPLREPNLDLLSESDIECLDQAIKRYGSMSFDSLKAISHQDRAFRDADQDDSMSVESIAASLPDGEKLLQHLRGE